MKKISKSTIYIAIGTLVLGMLIGSILFSKNEETQVVHAEHQAQQTIWSCTMHPQIKQQEPGKCPICGMELVPLKGANNEADPMEIMMSKTALQLANVQTAIVQKQKPEKTITLNSKVAADEP